MLFWSEYEDYIDSSYVDEKEYSSGEESAMGILHSIVKKP